MLVTTSEDSVKGRNLRHAGRAALCVDEEAPPYAFVLMEGRVDLIDDLAELRAVAGRIGARYTGADAEIPEFTDPASRLATRRPAGYLRMIKAERIDISSR